MYLSIQVLLSSDEVVRVDLRDEGTYPLKVFALMKEVKDGTSGEISWRVRILFTSV